MLKEKNKQENTVSIKKTLNEVIKEKQDFFMKSEFPKHSLQQMSDFAYSHKIIDKSNIQGSFIGSTIISELMLIIILSASFNNPGIGIILASLMGITIPISILFTETKYFKNSIFKIWKRKNESVLKDKMFENSIVDDEVLKCFVKENGEEILVKMLLEKENLTYNDLYQYTMKNKETLDLKNKEIRLTEAVKCLS